MFSRSWLGMKSSLLSTTKSSNEPHFFSLSLGSEIYSTKIKNPNPLSTSILFRRCHWTHVSLSTVSAPQLWNSMPSDIRNIDSSVQDSLLALTALFHFHASIHPFSIPPSSWAQGQRGLPESIPTVIGRRQDLFHFILLFIYLNNSFIN